MNNDEPGAKPASEDEIWRLKFNRAELRQRGRYPTHGRGRSRRANYRRHPLALPVVDGALRYPVRRTKEK